MKSVLLIPTLGISLMLACTSSPPESGAGPKEAVATPAPELSRVATFEGVQLTGLTLSRDGRLFVNFPRWRDGLPYSVVEVMADGSHKPYPNAEWNAGNGSPQAGQYTSVQSVVAQGGFLYVLDPANPKFQGVVGRPHLYEFDLASNRLKRSWEFSEEVAPESSYLNDLRVDEANQKIYITDSGLGALIVLDPVSGRARRLLDTHTSTKAENIFLTINGEKWLRNGQQPQIHSDGIALSPDNKYLYYHALTGYKLYRVPTAALNTEELTAQDLSRQVEDLGATPAPDGMIFDQRGNLYMADLEANAVVYRRPDGSLETLVQDDRIRWADTFTIGPDSMLYFTTSKLASAGGDISTMEFEVWKVSLAAD